ncbi:YggT family protein [Desulfurobacterium atlanticum]|uniref:YggT family protein n=1 Tax=Desulfurobacterium atlanticum TaxID=240169 RepID=A0A238YVL3_9BACT|nr:YggT family protein [Desulfurobacterium atlanticum]SNR75090.1 YggT family protein [Desulfurobacterium atlanticum]
MVREFLHYIIQFLIWFIIIGAVFTWIPPANRSKFADKIIEITDNFLEPIRNIIPPIGGIDISPLIAIIILQLIDNFIRRGF